MTAAGSDDFTADLSPRRRQILEAAVIVVADNGLKGLTHRAVDRQAGIPEGSTSAYLRTRSALQLATAHFLMSALARDTAELAAQLTDTTTPAIGAELATDLFVRWLEHPQSLRARSEFILEAGRDPDLAQLHVATRERLIAVLTSIPDATGECPPREKAELVVAASDGLLTAALHKPPAERAAFLRTSMEWLLTPVLNPDS